MRLACHQPNYFPNQNYFDKIAACDLFIILDDVQFEKNGFTNRNRIPGDDKELWMTIPIIHKYGQLIKDVVIVKDYWKRKHYQTLECKYDKGKCEAIKSFFDYESDSLIDWNIRSLKYVMSDLEYITSSMLRIETRSTERLIDICNKVGADTYVSGIGSKKYMDMELFAKAGIEVEFMLIKTEPYSILDTLLR
jgi:hypothetical protein